MPETTLIDTLLTQARQQLALGDAEQALSLAQHAYACAPHRPEATLALGEILLHSGQYDAAHALLWPAAQQWPHVAALHRCLGLLEQQLGQREAAIDSLRWACTLDPSQHDAAFRLAWALHDQGELDEALYWACHALAGERNGPRLLQTGWLLQQTGQLAAAAEHYQHAIAAYPAHAAEQGQLHLQLAECQLLLAHTAAAYATLDAGLRRFPDAPGLLTTLAHGQWRGGDALAAIRTARRLTELDPECVAHWHLLGVFLQDSGDWLAADRCFAQVQQRDLSQSESLFRRAQIQARAGRPADARWLLQ